jgi:hypothetical protein
MKKTSFTLLIIFCALTAYCQHNFVINLKNVATITFPDTPKINKSSQDTVYTTVNNGAIYLAGAMDAQKSLKELLTKHVLDSMYNGVITGTLESSHGKLIYKKNIIVNNLEGMEFGYTALVKIEFYMVTTKPFTLIIP